VVLLAERDGRVEVLKVARDEDHAARLRDERRRADTVRTPRSSPPTASRPSPDAPSCGSRRPTTLARQLEQEGPLSIDRLERFGDDLLDALEVLEDEGIAHRDIKPDNLGMIERGKNKERHLVLFDFSLTRADATNLHAGTAAYLDPFLSRT
jgi:serine/threonine protein kinase